MKFKVGDVCVGQNFVHHVECNGMECTVLGFEFGAHELQLASNGHLITSDFSIHVQWSDGEKTWQLPHELRLKRPPSWDKWIFDTSDVKDERETQIPEGGAIYFMTDDGVKVVRP